MMRGRNSRKVLSDTFLSWTASSAISTKPALFTYSSRLIDHSRAFPTANGVLSKRFPQLPSTTSHESKSDPPLLHLILSDSCRLFYHPGKNAGLMNSGPPQPLGQFMILPNLP